MPDRLSATQTKPFAQTLTRLELWLERTRPACAAQLAPGASAEQIARAEQRVGRPWPPALRAWFGFHDGDLRPPPARVGLVRDWHLLSLSEAAAVRDELDTLLLRGDFDLEGWWRPGWFPVLARPNGDLMVVDLEGTFDAPGAVVEWRHDDATRVVRAPGLEIWLGALVDSLEDGVWRAEPPDGLEWWETPEFAATSSLPGAFDELVPGYPLRIDLAAEREPAIAPTPTRADAWVAALCQGLSASARAQRWAALPTDFAALWLEAGSSLEEVTALLEQAEPSQRSAQRLAMLDRLQLGGDPRAVDVALASLSSDDPFELLVTVQRLGVADPVIAARYRERSEALFTRRPVGTAAYLLTLARALEDIDPAEATRLADRGRRLRPRGLAKSIVDVELARRCDPGQRAERLRALLGDEHFVFDLWREGPLLEAAWHAALAAGTIADLVESRTRARPARSVVLGLVSRLTASGLPALAQALQSEYGMPPLIPAGVTPWSQQHVAHIASTYEEGIITQEEFLTLMSEAVSSALRTGDTPRARKLLNELDADARRALDEPLARCRAALRDPMATLRQLARPSSAAELESLARAWDESQLHKSSTRALLLAIAQAARRADAHFARAQLDRVCAAITHRAGTMRFEAALAWALCEHERYDHALEVARDHWTRPDAHLLARVLGCLTSCGKRDEALALGHHLAGLTSLDDWVALAPAVLLFSEKGAGALRAALDAMAAVADQA